MCVKCPKHTRKWIHEQILYISEEISFKVQVYLDHLDLIRQVSRGNREVEIESDLYVFLPTEL